MTVNFGDLGAARPRQGDIWWAETEGKRRPVLVVTRDSVIDRLTRVVVAPITSRVRNIPTELSLGPEEGLAGECAASFDNLVVLPVSLLVERVGEVGFANSRICEAVTAMADC